MTIIVTGGAGFIGSNFIFHMLNTHLDDRIVCLDKLTYAGNLSTLAPVMGDPISVLSRRIFVTERRFITCLRKSIRILLSILRRKVMLTEALKIRVYFCKRISWVQLF